MSLPSLPTTGTLSLSQIAALYGISTSGGVSLSNLYANGYYGVGEVGSPNVPASGPILFGNFRGAKKRGATTAFQPPVMTSNSTVVNGLTYTAFSTNNYSTNYLPWNAFSGTFVAGSGWMSNDNMYNTSTGACNSNGATTAFFGDGYLGVRFGCSLPFNVYPVSYEISGNMRNYRIVAQRSTGVWDIIDEQTLSSSPYSSISTLNFAASVTNTPYKQFMVVINLIGYPSGFGRGYGNWFRINGYRA